MSATADDDTNVFSTAMTGAGAGDDANTERIDSTFSTVAAVVAAGPSFTTATDGNDDENETVMPKGKTTTPLDKLIILTLVSKRFHRIISTHEENGTKKWKLTPLFVLRPLKLNGGNTLNFLHRMNQYQQDDVTNIKLQRYLSFKVNHTDKFDSVPYNELKALLNNLRIKMKGIRSLNMSLLPSSKALRMNHFSALRMNHSLSRALARIMPNLRELNLSRTHFNIDNNILVYFSLHCPLLEKITWKYINKHEILGWMVLTLEMLVCYYYCCCYCCCCCYLLLPFSLSMKTTTTSFYLNSCAERRKAMTMGCCK